MDIEQQLPNRPNFMLVVVLSGATIIAVFLIAYFVLDWDAGGLLPKRHTKHPTSQLIHHKRSGDEPAIAAVATSIPALQTRAERLPAAAV